MHVRRKKNSSVFRANCEQVRHSHGTELVGGTPLELSPPPIGLFSIVQRLGPFPFPLGTERMVKNFGDLSREAGLEGVVGAADREG